MFDFDDVLTLLCLIDESMKLLEFARLLIEDFILLANWEEFDFLSLSDSVELDVERREGIA